MGELTLGILDRNEIEEVVAEAGDKIFCMGTDMGGHQHMAGVKYPFDHSKRSFHKGTGSADSAVSAFIFCRDGMIPDGSPHGLIH